MTVGPLSVVLGREVHVTEIVYDTTHERVDVEKLSALLAAVGWHDRARDLDRLARSVEGSRWVVTAWEGARLVGFCRAFTDGAFTAYVGLAAVLPDYQRRGIGREMVRRLMEGHDRIAFVLHARAEVQPFYRKLGYQDAPDMLRRPRST
ncbi:GNAT family N-acetyltransferase [bacterium]|nr:GNAT family N-acetyltransferase [bacterium]